MTLLRQIQDAALDSGTSLPDLLRRCKVLATRLKHQELAQWVDRELQGYPNSASAPDYRQTKINALGDFSGPYGSGGKNVPIPARSVPTELRHLATEHTFTESVSGLAALLETADGGVLQGKWPADVVAYLQRHAPIYEDMVLIDAWKVIPAARLTAILDTVRTRILEFVLAIEDIEPSAGDTGPGEKSKVAPEQITQIFNTTVQGGVASIGTKGNSTITTGDVSYSGQIPEALRDEMRELIAAMRLQAENDVADAADRTEALAALHNIEQQLAKPKPASERINAYLGIFASLVTVASANVEQMQQLLPRVLAALGVQ